MFNGVLWVSDSLNSTIKSTHATLYGAFRGPRTLSEWTRAGLCGDKEQALTRQLGPRLSHMKP